MEPITIIGILVGLFWAAALWDTLTDFLTYAIETLLPHRYGYRVARYVRKVIGVVRQAVRFYNHVEMLAQVYETTGQIVTLAKEYVPWSEVPTEVRQDIQNKGVYKYEQTV